MPNTNTTLNPLQPYATWTYIPFVGFDNYIGGRSLTAIRDIVTDYRIWLLSNAGGHSIEWEWHTGHNVAQGVYIKDEQVALIFRLRFGI